MFWQQLASKQNFTTGYEHFTKITMQDWQMKENPLTLNLSHKCSPPKVKSTGQIAAALRQLPCSTGCK